MKATAQKFIAAGYPLSSGEYRFQHITQRRHPVHNPDGPVDSENCGPTSLAMSLDRIELTPPYYPPGGSAQELIDASRYAMFSDRDGTSLNVEKDGVEFNPETGEWIRVQEEHMTLTNLEDVERGARNSGAATTRLASLEDVNWALDQHEPVVLAGNPALPGAWGERMEMDYDGGHFVMVTDYNDAGEYKLHDPLLADGPVDISSYELKSFLNADIFGDAIGVSFRPEHPYSTPGPGFLAREDVRVEGSFP